MIGDGEVLIGIVTYNRREKLVRALDACRQLGFEKIVVFDNGCTDGTRAILQNRSDISFFFTDRNEGCSSGFNRLMRYFVQESTCDWLLLFDDDAYPAFTYQGLAEYLQAHRAENRPGYALKVVYPDGVPCPMNRPGIDVLSGNPLRHLWKDFHLADDSESCPVDFASFSGLLLHRDTVSRIGIVSPKFYIYSDDTYYTLSISRNIDRLYYCSEFTLIHDCNRSSRNLTDVDTVRLEREVINKIVMVREYSRFKVLYVSVYLARLLLLNVRLFRKILNASRKGLAADLAPYRNEPV
jgi:GT2 family glycosyltransferase